MKRISLFIAISISLFILSSCKKDEATTQDLTLHFHNVSGSSPLDYSSTFTTSNGRHFNLSEFRYYLSGISLVKTDGSKVSIANKYLLVSPSVSDYALGKVPVGDYKGVEFTVGLDSAANHSDPATYDATNPLSIQTPPNHWDWNSGYIFVKLEGMCDTTTNNVGTLNHTLIYHLGLDANVRKITLNSNFTVSSGSSKMLTVVADINKYLTGADFTTVNETHTFDNATFATQLANNLQSMFSIQ